VHLRGKGIGRLSDARAGRRPRGVPRNETPRTPSRDA